MAEEQNNTENQGNVDKIIGIPREELFAQGHRAGAGCGSVLAMRYALKASGKNVIVCQATGCMEVVSSPYPETAWRVPWIHAAFENAAANSAFPKRANAPIIMGYFTPVISVILVFQIIRHALLLSNL